MRANVAWVIALGVFAVALVALGMAGDRTGEPAAAPASPRPAPAEPRATDPVVADPAVAQPGAAAPGGASVDAIERARPGQRIGIDGEGFPPGGAVEVVMGTAGGPLTPVGDATADEDGRLAAQVPLPDRPGTYVVGVRYADATVAGARTVTTEVTVEGRGMAMRGQPAPQLPAPTTAPAPAPAPPPGSSSGSAVGGAAQPPPDPAPGPIRTPRRIDIGGGGTAPAPDAPG